MDTFILIAVTGIGLGALYFLVACGLTLIYGLMRSEEHTSELHSH